MEVIKVFSPASIANLNCGFDLLGLSLEGIGDEITLRKVPQKGIKITSITGADLPLETLKNVAGVAGMAMVNHLNLNFGFEIQIRKGINIGSGIGGSAASAAAIVFGINQFLDKPLSNKELTFYGMKGEALASGSEHADNVAPAVYGGFTLITSYSPLNIVSLPVPKNLFVTIIRPHIEIKTKESRAALPINIPLNDVITQSGNLAGFISSLYTSDYDLMARSLKDVIIEPHRKCQLPLFDKARAAAVKNGAMAFGIGGSGPAMFSICKGKKAAEQVEDTLKELYRNSNIQIDSFVSKASNVGSKIIS
ncbi:MAG: homoserine kinase [Sediminicola sp.]|jgi:homoserine kinase|tara:strand:+ start:2259 stop:3182 length:924 start_codon:yes stop_codon:yes gene_type:complete